MDRNTLTALLLITIVLILTPYYMELISPPPQPTLEDSEEPNSGYDGPSDDYLYGYSANKETKQTITDKTDRGKNTTVESDLFIAK